MSHDEDRALERYLNELDDPASAVPGDADDVLLREYREVGSMLPFALEDDPIQVFTKHGVNAGRKLSQQRLWRSCNHVTKTSNAAAAVATAP